MMNSPTTGRRGLRSQTRGENKPADHHSVEDFDNKLNEERLHGSDESDSGIDRLRQRRSPSDRQTVDDSPGRRQRSPTRKSKPSNRLVNLQSSAKEHKTKKSRKTQKTTKPFTNLKVCAYCMVIIISAVAVYVLAPACSQVLEPKEKQAVFLRKLEELKEIFPKQSKRFWNIIAAAPMQHLKSPSGKESPDRPVVVMLAGQPGTSATISCIAHHLGQLYTIGLSGHEHNIEPVGVNGSHFVNQSPEYAKQMIDTALKNGFDSNSKAVVVHQFDKLPSCSVLLFHSYCENDNAPYTEVAIILTLELDSHVYTIGKEPERLVNNHLERRWLSCPEFEERGKIDAMLSRVANNVALVEKESDGSGKC